MRLFQLHWRMVPSLNLLFYIDRTNRIKWHMRKMANRNTFKLMWVIKEIFALNVPWAVLCRFVCKLKDGNQYQQFP